MHTALRFEIFVSVLLLSVLGTCVNSNISDQAVDGRVPPEGMIADRRETEGVVADEKGMIEEQKDEINVGEYCGHSCFC
jgi:hypothetical protein